MAMNINTGNSGVVKAETEVQNSGKIRVSEIHLNVTSCDSFIISLFNRLSNISIRDHNYGTPTQDMRMQLIDIVSTN